MTERADPMRIEGLGFGEALLMLRGGARVARNGWDSREQYVEIQYPGESSKMTRPYLVLVVGRDRVPYVPSQPDLLNYDWCLVREVSSLQYGHGGAEF